MTTITHREIENVVLTCMTNLNLARDASEQLSVEPQAPIFGPGSPLDSLGLVSLLIDIEENFADLRLSVSLSDERAMSQRKSPYRDVPTLVAYINQQLTTQSSTC